MHSTIIRWNSVLGLCCGLVLALLAGVGFAHEDGSAGGPVCLEGNFMLADAQNTSFAPGGPGRVLEMNIFTGERGITVNNPFNPGNVGNPICPDGIVCSGGPLPDGSGPWKPTGVLSGGLSGHAFITSAAQHALTEFHRDGTPIRTVTYPTTVDLRFGSVPRPLGTQMMPNGNIIQAICDANFQQPPGQGNAVNSDPFPPEGSYFPPVWSTPERAANSRLLVLDQETLEVIDEYSMPRKGELGHDLWGCMAGIAFSDEGMFISLFHGAAVLVIDWKAGINNEKSEGVGSNRTNKHGFKLGKRKNRAKVIRVIDMLGDESGPGDPNDPMRRDSLRAITFDEGGNLYATFRKRSVPCEAGDPCNPGVFRQHIAVVEAGNNYPTRTIALDPGVNIIAGIRTNRISGVACQNLRALDPTERCDHETLLVAASAFNPGCTDTGPVGANPCFVPGGGVGEYLIEPDAADNLAACSGDPLGDNSGCAQPVATYLGQGTEAQPVVDPRMLMTIHEAFIQ